MFIFIFRIATRKNTSSKKIENRLRLFTTPRGFIFGGKSSSPAFGPTLWTNLCENCFERLNRNRRALRRRLSNLVDAIDQQKAFKKELNCVGTFQWKQLPSLPSLLTPNDRCNRARFNDWTFPIALENRRRRNSRIKFYVWNIWNLVTFRLLFVFFLHRLHGRWESETNQINLQLKMMRNIPICVLGCARSEGEKRGIFNPLLIKTLSKLRRKFVDENFLRFDELRSDFPLRSRALCNCNP